MCSRGCRELVPTILTICCNMNSWFAPWKRWDIIGKIVKVLLGRTAHSKTRGSRAQ